MDEKTTDKPKKRHGLKCENCGSRFTNTVRTTPRLVAIVRERRCQDCGHKFRTIERYR